MLKLHLEIEIIRPDGTTRYKERQNVNSWVKAAAQQFEAATTHANVNIKDTGGGTTGHNPSAGDATFRLDTAASRGILVGTGSTAVTADDFQLETEIADGSASGELVRAAGVEYEGILGTSTGYTVLFEKTFTNSSGASITINEVAIYHLSTGSVKIMGVRDVLSVGVVVLDAESIVVRYFTDWDV